MKPKAKMLPCPGVVNDGLFGHSMRDNCSSCAPYWEQYPACPICDRKLARSMYCGNCRKYYALPDIIDLRAKPTACTQRDYAKVTFDEMADDVASIWKELKRRNPIGINAYGIPFLQAIANLKEISEAEKVNPTCEVER